MNSNEAKEIFLMKLPELSEPLKSAVEFALANWHKLKGEPRPSDIAINFFASLPALPSNDVDEIFAAKLNEMYKILRDDSDVWLSLNDLPHEQWRDVVGYEGLYQKAKRQFVVTSGDVAVIFDSLKKTLDDIALFVQF